MGWGSVLTLEKYGVNSSHEDSGIGELLLSSGMLWGKVLTG